MKRDIRDFANDILLHIETAEKALERAEKPLKYPSEEVMLMAYCLQIIGEAVKNIPDETRKIYSSIDWRKIAGMRDVLIHSYWGIDLEIVQLTVVNRLPELKTVVKQILEDYNLEEYNG
jgi:uncharacterized protein with HEPN domain